MRLRDLDNRPLVDKSVRSFATMAAPLNGTPAAQMQMTPDQANNYARNLILTRSQLCQLELPAQTLTAAQVAAGQSQMSFTPQNVGLVKGFWIQVTYALTNGGAGVATRTGRGAYNVLQNIKYYDLLYNNRVDISGFYLSWLNSQKIGWGFSGSYAPNLPNGIGGLNYPVNTGPATIAAAGAATITVFYYLPLAYSVTDTTGAVFAQTTGGVQNITLTINPNPGAILTDTLYAAYSGATAAVTYTGGSSINVRVWQDYWGQLPNVRDPNTNQLSYIVPTIDIGTSYVLNQTIQAQPTVGVPFPLQIANYRKMLSITAAFNNINSGAPNGEAAFGTAPNGGADITNWLLQAANYTPIRSWSPALLAAQNRNTLLGDMPIGSYLFDFRAQPLDSQVYGNLQISMTAATVNSATAYVYYGFEALADSAIVTQAGSLPSR